MNDKRLKPRTDTLRELYIFSGNMCAMPYCKSLLIDEYGTWIGEVAHIYAASNGGPRANSGLSSEDRRRANNLILVCSNCHTRIDSNATQYTAEMLVEIKEAHEAIYKKGLEQAKLRDCMDEYTIRLPQSLGAWDITPSDEHFAETFESLQTVATRLSQVPTPTRIFLIQCLRRSSEARFPYQHKELIANAEEIRQAISVEGKQISRNEITSHIRILEKYNFACFEEIDDHETGNIMLGDEAFVLSTARRIAEDEHAVISDGFLSTLETILVKLDFSSFEHTSRKQNNSGKEGQSRKKRRAKSSRHTK